MAKAKDGAAATALVAKPADLPAPDEGERAAIKRASGRIVERRRRFAVKVKPDGRKLDLSYPHNDSAAAQIRMLDTFGTSSVAFAYDAFAQVAKQACDAGADMPSETAVNAALALIDGIGPANEVEALLAMQMYATHSLANSMMVRAKQCEMVNQTQVFGALSVKLLRAFTAQVEALERLRRGGGQTVRVEHVHVHSGGQAIVGHVEAGGRVQPKIEEQPHAKSVPALSHADAPFDPLRSTDASRDAVPVARHA